MNTDSVAQMLTSIRNASMRKLKFVRTPHSRFKEDLARLMVREGFIEDVTIEGEGVNRGLMLLLKYHGRAKAPVCASIQRLSRPGLRKYSAHRHLPRNGFGIIVVSTSKGLMSDHDARAQGLGGELVCSISTIPTEK